MNDERFDLASAYLDGAVTADERALAEADPEIMELVAQLRAVSVAVADVEVPGHQARERAIDAALATAPPATAEVVPLAPRSNLSRILSYAAAVLAVGIVGSVVVTGLRGSGDDDLATSPDVTELFSTDTAGDTADETGDVEAVPEAFPAGDADDADDADTAMSTMEAPAADSAEPADTDGSDTDGSDTWGAVVVELDLLTEAELAELVRSLLDHDGSEERAAERLDVCPAVLDEVAIDDSLVTVFDGRPVVLGVSGEFARVVDPVGCDVLVEIAREHAPG